MILQKTKSTNEQIEKNESNNENAEKDVDEEVDDYQLTRAFDLILAISARTSPAMALLHTWLISEQETLRPENLTSQFWRYFHALGGSDSSELDQNY